MKITINAQGAERKRLVQTISNWLGSPAKYCGAPTFNYEVDYFTIDKNGSLSFDDSADSEVVERLLQHIYDEGFDIDQSTCEDEDDVPDTAATAADSGANADEPGNAPPPKKTAHRAKPAGLRFKSPWTRLRSVRLPDCLMPRAA